MTNQDPEPARKTQHHWRCDTRGSHERERTTFIAKKVGPQMQPDSQTEKQDCNRADAGKGRQRCRVGEHVIEFRSHATED